MKNKTSIYLLLIWLILHSTSFSGNAETTKYASEQIHVHVQKNVFLSGESVLYKLYCINSITLKPSTISKVAYIELIDENGYAVAQDEVILNNGMGSGGFQISPQLPSGNYAINAYSHWMNSTSKELINVTPIFIYNNQNLLSNRRDSLIRSHKTTAFYDLKDNKINLLNSQNFNSEDKYFSISSTLEDLERYIHFTVRGINKLTNNSEIYKFQIFSREGKIIDQDFKLEDNNWHFRIHKKDLSATNYSVCIKDLNGTILSHLTVHLALNHKGRFIEKPKLNTTPRKKIELSLRVDDFSQNAKSIFLSASVKLKEPFQTSTNIVDYFNLYSDFGASMNVYYKDLEKVKTKNWIAKDGLQPLWINTKSVYEVTSNQYPENEAYVLEGQIKKLEGKKVVVNKNVYLSKIGEYADINTFKTDEDGKFFFQLPLKKGFHDVSIQLNGDVQEECSIQLKEKFNQKGVAPVHWKKEDLSEDQLQFIKKRYETTRIQNLYGHEDFIETIDSSLYRGEINFFGKPYLSVKIDDFIRLDSLEEYFHEFIAPVKIKYRKNKSYMNVYNPERMSVMEPAPLMLYDGLIISDPRIILNKRPSEIERIEVMPYEYYYGKSHFYGIIHTISKEKNCQIERLPKNTERYYLPLFVNSYALSKNTYTNIKYAPDFRTDLLWEPNISLTKDDDFELEFTTSDVKGEYELKIEGITEDGEPIVFIKSIIVE